jgi:hypothetical protein
MAEKDIKDFVEEYGFEPVWETDGVLRIGPWMACFDPSGKIFWDHKHDEVWCAVELDSEETHCECGDEVPGGLVAMAGLQKLNPKSQA